jgi:hypothetical protein
MLRPPRRVRKAKAFLVDRLEAGETPTTALRVQTGSLLFYLVVAIPVLALWFGGWDLLHRGGGSESALGWIFIVGYAAITLVGQRLILKPRLLAVTDRRLFVLTLSPLTESVAGVEAEISRHDVRATLADKDRLIVSGTGDRPISLRLPYGYRRTASYLRDWAGTG